MGPPSQNYAASPVQPSRIEPKPPERDRGPFRPAHFIDDQHQRQYEQYAKFTEQQAPMYIPSPGSKSFAAPPKYTLPQPIINQPPKKPPVFFRRDEDFQEHDAAEEYRGGGGFAYKSGGHRSERGVPSQPPQRVTKRLIR